MMFQNLRTRNFVLTQAVKPLFNVLTKIKRKLHVKAASEMFVSIVKFPGTKESHASKPWKKYTPDGRIHVERISVPNVEFQLRKMRVAIT